MEHVRKRGGAKGLVLQINIRPVQTQTHHNELNRNNKLVTAVGGESNTTPNIGSSYSS